MNLLVNIRLDNYKNAKSPAFYRFLFAKILIVKEGVGNGGM